MLRFGSLLVFFSCALGGYAQREILNSTLSEYGPNLKYQKVWTDDDFIVLLTKGSSSTYMFFLINPEKGIQSTYTLDHVPSFQPINNISSTHEEITVFFKARHEGKMKNHALSFSKSSNKVERRLAHDDLDEVEKQVFFRCIQHGRPLFASITKDKQTLVLRELDNKGDAKFRYIFRNMPKELWDFMSDITNPDYAFGMNIFALENSIRVLVSRNKNSMVNWNVFDLDLTSSTIKNYTWSEAARYEYYDPSFKGDTLFILKGIRRGKPESMYYAFHLDILNYPKFERLAFFSVDQASNEIPFKESHTTKVTYKEGLYLSGNNREYEDMEKKGSDIPATVKAVTGFGMYLQTYRGNQQKTLLKIGKTSAMLITNTAKVNIAYFFGCLDANLNPCKDSERLKSPEEKMSDYLTSIQENDPELTEFGYARRFLVLKQRGAKEIKIMEF